jgi:hypothetical protein
MPRKSKKLESLSQAHGKIQDKFEITHLDQIWGTGDNSKFGTTDENEFANKLKGMTRADLENFARKHGSIIVENSDRIRSELLKVFRNYVSLLQKPAAKPAAKQIMSPEAQRVLNEGR